MAKQSARQLLYTSLPNPEGKETFGIRAFIGRFSDGELDALAETCIADGYPVVAGSEVTAADLEADPERLTFFPPLIAFSPVALPSGKIGYALWRKSYLGAPACYFNQGTTDYQGTPNGSNFACHIFLFDREPDFSQIAFVLRNGLFRPNDLSARGAEMRRLGSSEEMQLSEPVSSGSTVAPSPQLLMLLAVRYFTRLGNNDSPASGRISVALPSLDEQSLALFADRLAAMPEKMTSGLSFSLNTLLSTPTGMLLTTDESNADYIVARSSLSPAVAAHPVAGIIAMLTERENTPLLTKFLKWLLGLKAAENSRLFLELGQWCALNYPLPIPLSLLTSELLQLAPKRKGDARTNYFKAIAEGVNSLLMSSSGKAIAQALNIVSESYKLKGARLTIAPEVADRLAQIIFLRGKEAFLGRLVDAENIRGVTGLLSPDRMGPLHTFLDALSQSDSVEVWIELLRHYFNESRKPETETVLDAIAASGLSDEDKQKVITSLIPTGSLMAYITEMVEWYGANPDAIMRLPAPLLTVVMSAREECFSRFLSKSSSDEVLNFMRQPMIDFFTEALKRNANASLVQIVRVVEAISPEKFEKFNLIEPLLLPWLDNAWNNPGKGVIDAIKIIRKCSLTLPDGFLDRMLTLHCLLTSKLPSKIDAAGMLLSLKIRSVNAAYFTKLANLWAKEGLEITDLREFMQRSKLSDAKLIGALIMAFWTTEATIVAARRKDYIITIADYGQWTQQEREQFTDSLSDSRLVSILRDSDSSVGRFLRKIFK